MLLKYLPVVIFLGLPTTLLITFGLAVYYKHVTYLVPYISDSGAFPPESCIFGQMLNIVSILMGLASYVRYRQIKEIYTKHDFPNRNHTFNKISYYVGLIAASGVSIVANFQESVMLPVHWAGAVMAFGLGSIYGCLQTIIYYNIYPIFGKKTQNLYRAILSVVSSTTFIIFFISGMMANQQFHGTEATKWKKEDGGFELHVISSVSEWICSSCIMFFLLLFIWDFEEISLNEPEIFVHDNFTVPVNVHRRSGTETV